jgi:hypothetical protein
MSEPHPTGDQANEPTAKQKRALRALARSRGQTFAYPRTRAQASAEIARLLRATPSSASEHAIEVRTGREIAPPNSATAVRRDEVSGYGSNCTWSHGHGEGTS